MSTPSYSPTHVVSVLLMFLFSQALQRRLAVPDWDSFTANVTSIYELVKRTEFGGKNADYISVLSEQVRWTRAPSPLLPSTTTQPCVSGIR
jgi:hypothetical protein